MWRVCSITLPVLSPEFLGVLGVLGGGCEPVVLTCCAVLSHYAVVAVGLSPYAHCAWHVLSLLDMLSLLAFAVQLRVTLGQPSSTRLVRLNGSSRLADKMTAAGG